MARKKKTNFLVSAHRTLRKKSVVAAVYIVLRLLVILMMVAQFFNGLTATLKTFFSAC